MMVLTVAGSESGGYGVHPPCRRPYVAQHPRSQRTTKMRTSTTMINAGGHADKVKAAGPSSVDLNEDHWWRSVLHGKLSLR